MSTPKREKRTSRFREAKGSRFKWNSEYKSLRLLASESKRQVLKVVTKCKVKLNLRKQWLATRFAKCFATSTRNQRGTQNGTAKRLPTRIVLLLRKALVAEISTSSFVAFTPSNFIDHSNSNRDGKELTPPFPAGRMELWLQAKLELRQEPEVPKAAFSKIGDCADAKAI
jgi:hypothetical protein